MARWLWFIVANAWLVPVVAYALLGCPRWVGLAQYDGTARDRGEGE